jgi:osmotically-inducible protein OsmY
MAWRFSRGRRRRGGGLASSIAGFAAGAGLIYLLDPRRGAGRRSQVAQRAGRVLREVEQTVEAGARELRHRARGLAHEAAARVERDLASDDVIVERVRAKLGRLSAHPSAIRVVSHGGRVELSGPIFSAERSQVLRGVRIVRGVRGVEDRLEPHDDAAGVPALQGAGPMPAPRPAPLQRHWAPRTRLLAGVAGTFLVCRALFGKGLGRIPAGVAGAALLGKVMGGAQAVPREARRTARAASDAANRERERRSAGEAHAGAWHPEGETGGLGKPGGTPGKPA